MTDIAVPQDRHLRDGTSVRLRPIRPDDVERLHRLFHRLSPDTVYLRFFMPVTHPSGRVLRYLAGVDGRNRIAVVAERDGEVLGVARCDRVAPGEAEVAVVVEDAWQGRGLGRLLLSDLRGKARAAGIERFVASMLPENQRAIDLSVSAPGTTFTFEGHEVVARIPVTEPSSFSILNVAG